MAQLFYLHSNKLISMASTKKTALITGASSGFGLEFAKLFAKDGYDVVLVSRNPERLAEVAMDLKVEYGVRTVILEKDLSVPGSAKQLYDEVQSSHITVDVLVNNAGVSERGFFHETDMEKELSIIHLNIISVFELTKLFLRDMVARNDGRILQLSSTAAKAPQPLMAVYGATKAFVYSFSQAIINELKDTNVSMTVLLPGPSDTDFFHKAHAEDTKVYKNSKLSNPKDVARDGYKALMKGKGKIVSGIKNKVQVAMSNVLSHESVTAGSRKYMEEEKESKREVERREKKEKKKEQKKKK
jgi:short-subunit dehydrogenase